MAAFAYALLHTSFYLVNESATSAIAALAEPTYLAGWIGFAIMVVLAITSTDGALRRLGKRWKVVHRGAYVAAVAGALHWLLKPGGGTVGPVLVHFIPLLLLQLNRLRIRPK